MTYVHTLYKRLSWFNLHVYAVKVYVLHKAASC